ISSPDMVAAAPERNFTPIARASDAHRSMAALECAHPAWLFHCPFQVSIAGEADRIGQHLTTSSRPFMNSIVSARPRRFRFLYESRKFSSYSTSPLVVVNRPL